MVPSLRSWAPWSQDQGHEIPNGSKCLIFIVLFRVFASPGPAWAWAPTKSQALARARLRRRMEIIKERPKKHKKMRVLARQGPYSSRSSGTQEFECAKMLHSHLTQSISLFSCCSTAFSILRKLQSPDHAGPQRNLQKDTIEKEHTKRAASTALPVINSVSKLPKSCASVS